MGKFKGQVNKSIAGQVNKSIAGYGKVNKSIAGQVNKSIARPVNKSVAGHGKVNKSVAGPRSQSILVKPERQREWTQNKSSQIVNCSYLAPIISRTWTGLTVG